MNQTSGGETVDDKAGFPCGRDGRVGPAGGAVLLISGNAVFVAAETALVTVDRNFVESQAQAGDVRFGRVAGLLRRLSTYLSGAQRGIAVTILAIGLVEPSVTTLLRGPLGRAVCLTALRTWPQLCWRC